MVDDARKFFHGLLRERFAPELRKLGFKGSGNHFRRVRGEVINAINIQGNKYGGSCAVNLGLHLAFLPYNWKSEIPDPTKIKEIDCEFRSRLAPGRRSDYWWKYDGLLTSPRKQVDHLVNTYLRFGEPMFARYESVEDVAKMISLDDVSRRKFVGAFGNVSVVRAALTMARIHQHLGNRELAMLFAQAGMENIGRATSLRPEFQTILEANQS
ncbi:MAG: DUF4304 domain-containing protein [Woeseiaceae bacterium]|nr:DUF4304 domain-containing protein [Woeseiaceae bacterium]